jgi:hypothetical protein
LSEEVIGQLSCVSVVPEKGRVKQIRRDQILAVGKAFAAFVSDQAVRNSGCRPEDHDPAIPGQAQSEPV